MKPGRCAEEAQALKELGELSSVKRGFIDMGELQNRSTNALQKVWFGCSLYRKYQRALQPGGKAGKEAAEDVFTGQHFITFS